MRAGSARGWALAAAVTAALAGAAWLLRRPAPENTARSTSMSMPLPAPASAPAKPTALSASQVERGVDEATQAVQRDPQDAAGWAMLAHTYEMQGRFDRAVDAYRKLLELRPQDAQAHSDAADAMGVLQHGSLQGEPARLIARALVLDPSNLKALVLGGKEAFERRSYAEAIALWQRALPVTTDPAVRRPVQTSIAEARALMGSPASASAASAADAAPFIAGRVEVSAALRGRIEPDDAVFIYARPVSGSRMPVALLRKRGRDLPLDFALDDTLAMVPQALLSQQTQVMLGVHVSHRGDAIPTAGDLEGELGPVRVGAKGLVLRIDHVHQ
jgi:cytochrome c-type biogenesis protein CcmH